MIKFLKRKTHLSRVISFLFIAGGIICILSFDGMRYYCLCKVRDFLDFKPLNYGIISLSILIGLYYSYFYVRVGKSKEISLFRIFGPLLDPPVNSIGYGLAITSTLTLFKGIYEQLFFKTPYFVELNLIDIATILLACIPLLIWSVSGLVNFFTVVFIKKDSETGFVEGIDEGNNSGSLLEEKTEE